MRPWRASATRPFPLPSRPAARRSVILSQRHGFARRAALSTSSRVSVKQGKNWFGSLLKQVVYGASFYAAAKYLSYKFLDGGPVLDVKVEVRPALEAEGAGEEGQGGKVKPEENEMVVLDDDEAFFLSMQYPTKMPRTAYKASDSEFQEFARLSKDAKRKMELRRELGDRVVTAISRTKQLQARLGGGVKWTKSWLDFIFPDGPPPEYKRKGLLVVEDEMSWSTQMMPHSDYVKLRNILYPQALYGASKKSLGVLWSMQKVKVKEALGWELAPQEKTVQLALKLATMKQHALSKMDEQAKAQQQVRKQNADKLGPPDEAAALARKQAQQEQDGALGPLSNLLQRSQSLPLATDVTLALRTFLHALASNWARARLDRHPPGCCYLWGDVEVQGAQGRAKVSVMAACDPRTNKFVWVSARPTFVWQHRQGPKGGA